ncbi:MAG: nitroreductase family protein [Eubacteriales bacterium]
MELQKPVIQIINERISCRSFDKKKNDDAALNRLSVFIDETNKEVKSKLRFILTNKTGKKDDSPEKLGTYGVISGANLYIIGIVGKSEKDEAEFGYLFEKIVLFATSLGLGTCWLGGTFKRADFVQKASLAANEYIPIVSPVGIKREKIRLLDMAMRAGAGSNKRKPWSELFFETNDATPLTEEAAGKYKTVLEMVRLAPSASNKQPWRVIKDKNSYRFYICRTDGYGMASYDLQKNDLGIAMCHFELASQELGLKGDWIKKNSENVTDKWEYVSTWVSAN